MSTIRCPKCKQIYEYSGPKPAYCPSCSAQEEAEYLRVREYVKEHPRVRADFVSRELDVPYEKVMQYLREERLEIATPSQWFLRCESCGRPVTTGTKCPDCKRKYGG